ncbi:MAG: hypothetical protein AAGI01_10750 [Myxococcota bacterium]
MKRLMPSSPLLHTSLAAFACALFVLALPATAAAQPTDDDIRTAQQAFDTGVEKYRAEDYAAALRAFERAHAAVPNPIFLYNVALCQSKLDRYDEAMATSRAAESLFAEFAEQLPPSEATKNAAALSAWSANQSAKATTTDIAAKLVKPPSLGRELNPLALATTSVGALTALVGLGIGLSLSADVDELRRLSESNDEAEFDRFKQEVERKQRRARFTTFAGAVIIAGGLTLWVLRRPTDSNPDTARITFGGGPGQASVGVKATF